LTTASLPIPLSGAFRPSLYFLRRCGAATPCFFFIRAIAAYHASPSETVNFHSADRCRQSLAVILGKSNRVSRQKLDELFEETQGSAIGK
jgi:hypothetical protein